MVTHCRHQVKQRIGKRGAIPPGAGEGRPDNLAGNPWPQGLSTSFKDPSGEAGKESAVAPRPRGAAEPGDERELLSAGDVARTIARMAHQVIEKTALGADEEDPPVLLGIPTRGTSLAARLTERI